MTDTSELDRLSAQSAEYNALMEFLEEFLPSEQMVLYQHRTGLTDQRVCGGETGRLMDYCRWVSDEEPCSRCKSTGLIEVALENRDLMYVGNKQDLVYKFLGLDPQKIEEQRRALLASL